MPWNADDPPKKPSRSRRPDGRATRRSSTPEEYRDAARGMRLQKVLAEAGVASRRACEAMIEAGEVAVNGTVVTELPIWVDARKDRITVKGKPVFGSEKEQVYVMLFKPRGVVSTNSDPEGRLRAIDLVRHPSKARLFPVGRLDLDSSGLLLLTNDGELAHRLTHPSHEVAKVYEITVEGELSDQILEKLERGIMLTDAKQRGRKGTPVARAQMEHLKVVKRDRDRTRMLMELREGRNRQIRRMMATLGHPVKKLRRVRMGPLKLSGLKPKEWRELTYQELRALRKAAGL